MSNPTFYGGVIEGFNGRPWNARQRHQLFFWMRSWKLNTYIYAAKGDLKQRLAWRELYSEMDLAEMAALIRDCQRHELQFVFALNPGLELCEWSAEKQTALVNKARQILGLGCRNFALLFEDIPNLPQRRAVSDFHALAQSHCRSANELRAFLNSEVPGAGLWLCPASTCSRDPALRAAYLETVGERLDHGVEIIWTGPGGVCATITVTEAQRVQAMFRRKPVLWDNLYANDYDPLRLYLGPYSGRPLELRGEVRGILCNPNSQFEINFVPLRTLALFLEAPNEWHPREAYLAALKEWLPAFAAEGAFELGQEDLELLGDIFYRPFEFGKRIEEFLHDLSGLVNTPPPQWSDGFKRFQRTCAEIDQLTGKLAYVRNRELFFALFPSLSRLKTELALVRASLEAKRSDPSKPFGFAPPGFPLQIFRGGLVGALQQLLPITLETAGERG